MKFAARLSFASLIASAWVTALGWQDTTLLSILFLVLSAVCGFLSTAFDRDTH